MNPNRASKISKINPRKGKNPPYVIKPSKLKRFSSKNIIFERVQSDPSWKGYQHMYDENVLGLVKQKKPGFSRFDFALSCASWIVHDAFRGGFAHTKIKTYRTAVDTVGIDWTRTRPQIDDPAKMSAYIKRAAKLFGASLTGICKLNKDWLYAEARIPRRCENAIVMAVEMDPEAIATSPAIPAAAATGTGYSKMALILACMGEFVRNLGYEAVQCGNDTALSIPLAIDAGLGELGRNGLLITPQYGSRIRLCKLLTNLPLEPDKPVEFGVKDFCKKCRLCAKNCKPNAISMDDEPSFEIVCRSNNPGVMKWYVNAELCYQFWCENGGDCSTCIAVCPYNTVSSKTRMVDPQEFWGEC